MKFKTKRNLKYSLVLLSLIVMPAFLTVVMNNRMESTILESSYTNNEDDNEKPVFYNNYNLKTSDIIYTGTEYDLSEWWDTRFRFRIGIEVEEVEGIDRHEPVDFYLTFEDNEHYEDSARLVSFNATGNDEWSSEIPIQVWNVTKYGSEFIESCTITFLADVSANSNQTYFLYFNENLNNIGVPSYNTAFTSSLAGGKLTVTVGSLGDIYKAVLEEGLGVTDLIKDTVNFHSDESLSPEKQLAHPNLRFLAHMDEGTGNYVNDSTGNVSPGQLINSPIWTDGIVRYGLDFEESSNQFVNFGAALDATGDPFNGASTEFTITAWIKPESLTNTRSNHYTQNCFIAKAHDTINDNFEIGINSGSISGTQRGTIHVYIDCDGSSADRYTDFGNLDDIKVGEWNFIAFRFNTISDICEVRINDNWYSSNLWSDATDLDEADTSTFTIGSTDHIETYFDGSIDEVAIYNVSLSKTDIENYKYGSETSVIDSITEIENGEVFSRYEVNWTESFDMHVSDICTFYYDFNLWNINRTIYFDGVFDGSDTNSQMIALNSYYDLSGLTQNDEFYFFYDNNYVNGLVNDGFIVENYTIIHDPIHLDTKDTLGIFIANYYKSGEPAASVSYLNGTVYYDSTDQLVRYTPGIINDFNNNGKSSNTLHIEFWEYIDNINHTAYSPKLTEGQMIQLFEDQYVALKNPLDIYIYEKESKFYNLEINVTDIDGNIVPEAKVTVWNATDFTMNWTQYTDDEGITTFTRLNNGSYIANVTYEKYGKAPLTITTPKIIDIDETTVDSTGLNKTSFTNVELTSLNLTLNRVNDLGEFQDYLEGAEVTFYIDSGLGNELIGPEYADENGNVILRWQNFTTPVDGNLTFSIMWFVSTPTNVTALGDLDGQDVTNTNVTFYFYTANSSTVNCVFGNSFESNLDFTVYPDPDFNQMLGETLNFQVNFTYIQDGTTISPALGATMTYNVKLGTINVNIQTLYFTEIGGGLYNLTIDTSNPIETGGANWFSENDYLIEVHAFKAGFISGDTSTSFILDPRTSTLVGNETELTAYWGETLVMEVVYTDVSFGGNTYIDGATVEYSVIGLPTAVGSLTAYGSGGRYIFSLATTEFPTSDSYVVQIIASKQNYQEKSVFIDVNILAIKSLINDTVAIYEDINLAYMESEIYYFIYTIESTGAGLSGAETRTYEWTKEVSGSIVDSGAGALADLGNGLYSLNFNTQTLEIATYTIIFNIEKENYVERGGIFILNIIPRTFNVILPSDSFEDNIVSAISGKSLTFTIDVTDDLNGSYVSGSNVYLNMGGQDYLFDDLGNGTYSISISELPNAFFLNVPISAEISVDKTNYAIKLITITINVKIVEIFPGFPMFYFLIIVIGAAAIVGSLVTYRAIQKARIPTFVKKATDMRKSIKGKKGISESLLYPSKEQYIVKKLGDKWEMLGLSLGDILGLETKKKKKLPEFSEQEGGVI